MKSRWYQSGIHRRERYQTRIRSLGMCVAKEDLPTVNVRGELERNGVRMSDTNEEHGVLAIRSNVACGGRVFTENDETGCIVLRKIPQTIKRELDALGYPRGVYVVQIGTRGKPRYSHFLGVVERFVEYGVDLVCELAVA